MTKNNSDNVLPHISARASCLPPLDRSWQLSSPSYTAISHLLPLCFFLCLIFISLCSIFLLLLHHHHLYFFPFYLLIFLMFLLFVVVCSFLTCALRSARSSSAAEFQWSRNALLQGCFQVATVRLCSEV